MIEMMEVEVVEIDPDLEPRKEIWDKPLEVDGRMNGEVRSALD